MDVGRAFTYVTEDPEWVKKVLIGGVIVLASMLLSLILIGLVGYILLLGYYVEVMRRVHAGTPTPMPEWDDLGGYITRGFIAAVGVLIWTLPFTLITCVGIVIGSLINEDAGGVVILGTVCVLTPFLLALGIFVLPIVVARYAVTGDFNAMFQFSEVFAESRRILVPLLIVFVMSIVVSFVAYIGLIACFIGIAFTTHYAYLVHSYLIGDAYRQATGGSTTPQAAF